MNPADLSPLLNHLWQSTLFAGGAGLLTLALRNNRARVRHWVWLAASCKFLVPLSVLIALGGQIEWRRVSKTTQSNLSVVVAEFSQPFTETTFSSPLLVKAPPAANALPSVLWGIWACGFLGIAGAWWVRWQRIKVAVRAGSPLQLAIPIPAMSSPTSLEPGVFGVFRPVLLLPEGMFERLAPAECHAVIAHELCHVRHRDNLIAAIHMFVETVFWFHPLVWWLGKRMVEERERACDEEVLLLGSEPRVYAEGILKICKLYVELPLEAVSGITGSDLKKRIEAIMANRIALRLNAGKQVALAAAAVAALAAPIIVGMMIPPSSRAQSANASTMKFDVASVKACKEEPNTGNERRREYTVSPGRANIQCLTLERIIFFAYAGIGNMSNPLLNDHPGNSTHVRGGPGWIRSDKFTIEATAEGTSDREVMMGPMLRALLEERFQLKTHRESEDVPMYAMTVAKGGLKIQPLAPGGCTSFDAVKDLSREEIMAVNQGAKPVCGTYQAMGDGVNRKWSLGGENLSKFANQTLSSVLDRYVIDKTGITGIFNIHLEFGLDENIRVGVFGGRGVGPPPPDIEKGPSIFTALEQQLGLTLEKTRGSHEFLVIDRVERPSGN